MEEQTGRSWSSTRSLQPRQQLVRQILAVLIGHPLHRLAHDIDGDAHAGRALHERATWFVLCRSDSSWLVSMLSHIELKFPKIGSWRIWFATGAGGTLILISGVLIMSSSWGTTILRA